MKMTELNASRTGIEIDNDARDSNNTEGFTPLRDTESTESNASRTGIEMNNDARRNDIMEELPPRNELTYTRENFAMKKKHLIIFVSQDGDKGRKINTK
jgi:hypothetical protein